MNNTGNDHVGYAAATQKFRIKLIMLQLFEEEIPWRVVQDGRYYRDNEKGERELAYFPTSEKAFAQWSLVEGKSQYPEIQRLELVVRLAKVLKAKGIMGDSIFDSHGRATFASPKRAKEQAKARASFKVLNTVATAQLQRENHGDSIKQLKNELEAWKARTSSAGAAALDDFQEAAKARKDVKEWKRAFDQLRSQNERMQIQYEEVIAAKDVLISELRKHISNIDRFKSTSADGKSS